ncbi:hypothetical protein CYY_001757 [Polysphondylium violaceum]|uniref:Transmembrane protein n=1 Tax=Polysphondylium violaceum TaxID=133409 RepID=A0A8J4VA97_9MYCE|nr:hypothetical protein CYY_001757 [Polysphondylium violaceum]
MNHDSQQEPIESGGGGDELINIQEFNHEKDPNNNNNNINNNNIVEKKNDFKTVMKDFFIRFSRQNNRSLATVLGCIGGFILGVVLFANHSETFPLVGSGLSTGYRIVGMFLAAGTGGNLGSYIGGSIDILGNEKTIFDLFRYLHSKYSKSGRLLKNK